jgi:secreted Zn-dependent insulinase-like peptidase
VGQIEIHGIYLKFSGFTETVFSFISLVFDRIANLEKQPNLQQVFALVQDHLGRGMGNEESRCKFSVQTLRKRFLLGNVYGRAKEKAEAAKQTTLEEVLKLSRKFLSLSRGAGLVSGSIGELSIKTMWEKEVNFHVHDPKARKIEEKTLIVEDHTNGHEHNCVVSVYLQFSGGELETDALADVLDAVMREPMFDELRTKRQLGYEVACGARGGAGVIGFEYWVQSAAKSPSELLRHMYEFVENFQVTLEKMEEEEFRSTVESVIHTLREKPHSLGEEAGELWTDIVRKRNFHHYRIMAEWLQKHMLEQKGGKQVFMEWYREQVVLNEQRLGIVVIGAGSPWRRETEEPILRNIF